MWAKPTDVGVHVVSATFASHTTIEETTFRIKTEWKRMRVRKSSTNAAATITDCYPSVADWLRTKAPIRFRTRRWTTHYRENRQAIARRRRACQCTHPIGIGQYAPIADGDGKKDVHHPLRPVATRKRGVVARRAPHPHPSGSCHCGVTRWLEHSWKSHFIRDTEEHTKQCMQGWWQ